MKSHAVRSWVVGLTVGGLVSVAAVAVGRHRTPEPVAPPAAAPQVRDADSVLREAALARFKNGSVGLRVNNGMQVAPTDASHEAAIKVNLFKKVLARELAQKDPSFPMKAEQSLLIKKPAELIVEWDDPSTGKQWIRYISANTSDCAFPEGSTFQVEAGGLQRHPCLMRSSLKTRWPTGAPPVLSVEVVPLDPQGPEWKQLVEDEMKELAAVDFLRAGGHTLAALPEAGRME